MKTTLIVLFVSVLSFSCAKKLEMPPDITTESQREKINSTVSEIEELYRRNGHGFEFNVLPIYVSDISESHHAGGLCIYDTAIVVDKSVFDELEKKTFSEVVDPLWRVLLHEIGHCYLGQDHDDHVVFAPAGMQFAWESKHQHGNKVYCSPAYSDFVMGSVMTEGARNYNLPLVFKTYFALELIGEVTPTFQEMIKLDGVTLAPENEVPKTGESIPVKECD